jgi:hypothetical protein
MSSRKIAELCEERHDNVKRAIDALAERGVIELPQSEAIPTATKLSKVYHLGKLDTLVVVAQLSPEFTARVVDRWQQFEAERAPFDPSTLLNSPAIMRGLLLSYTEKVPALESEVDAMRDDVAAHERLTKADGSLSTPGSISDTSECARPLDPQAAVSLCRSILARAERLARHMIAMWSAIGAMRVASAASRVHASSTANANISARDAIVH